MNLSFNRSFRSLSLIFLAVCFAISFASCGSSRSVAASSSSSSSSSRTSSYSSSSSRKAPKRQSRPQDRIRVSEVSSHPVTSSLLKEADSWIGTPYAWGGNDRKGVDCSGFVTQVFLRSLDISLPRTSQQQMEYCRPVDRKDLLPGDLVFFTVRGGDRVGHVGIYIGNGQMVHASSSKGVVITPLDNPYFVANYFSSGRVDRYMAMIDKKKSTPAKPTPSSVKAPVGNKAGQTVASRKKTPAPKKTQPEKKEVKKDVKTDVPSLSTPLPSQVFAEKPVKETPSEPSTLAQADDEEEPDFFD